MRPTGDPHPLLSPGHPALALCLSPGWTLDLRCSLVSSPVSVNTFCCSGLDPGPSSSPHLVQSCGWTLVPAPSSACCAGPCPFSEGMACAWFSLTSQLFSLMKQLCSYPRWCFLSFRQVEQQCRPPRNPSRRPPWRRAVGLVYSALGVKGYQVYMHIAKIQEVHILLFV